MERARLKAYLTVAALIICTSAFLAATGEVPLGGIDYISSELPGRIGMYRGVDLFYCQNDQCAEVFTEGQAAMSNACPSCGAALARLALAEKRLLPPDTLLYRKRYLAPDRTSIQVSILVTGKERKSIHKPSDCLAAQGFEIRSGRVVPATLESGRQFRIQLLDLGVQGAADATGFVCAYWFEDADRSTPHHYQRLFWMAWDSVVRNVRSRWAYVSLTTERTGTGDDHVRRISEFVAELYPQLRRQQNAK